MLRGLCGIRLVWDTWVKVVWYKDGRCGIRWLVWYIVVGGRWYKVVGVVSVVVVVGDVYDSDSDDVDIDGSPLSSLLPSTFPTQSTHRSPLILSPPLQVILLS